MVHDDPDHNLIAQRIKDGRKMKRMTQEKLAEHTKISVRFMSYIETGKKKASLKSLCKIARVLDIAPRFLIFGD
ncbi:MAG: helix-turn-helix domain-containing protein [Betaproteobacteria bacterium]|nr:helix-turn-helix domain-containing protein [Betaproteobacteria bacterium]